MFCSFASFGVRQVSSLRLRPLRMHQLSHRGACLELDLGRCEPLPVCGSNVQHQEEMDGAKFAKLCRDTKLLSRAFTPTDVDLFFAKARAAPGAGGCCAPDRAACTTQPCPSYTHAC